MNIFKKIKYANKVLKVVNELKKHFNQNAITQDVRTKVENFINAFNDLKTIVPECNEEIDFVIETIKKIFN